METARLTKAIIDKNSSDPVQVTAKNWYVAAGTFRDKNRAQALTQRLKKLGFTVFMSPSRQLYAVLVGPYEYRGHAGNGMERLKELAHVEGVLVTYKQPPPKA